MGELAVEKRKLNCKSIAEKYKIFKENKQWASCGEIIGNNGISKQTLSS